jgi:hypothetical protein
MKDEDLQTNSVMALVFEFGMTEPAGVALKVTYAKNKKKFLAKKFDHQTFVMTNDLANALLKLLKTHLEGAGEAKH